MGRVRAQARPLLRLRHDAYSSRRPRPSSSSLALTSSIDFWPKFRMSMSSDSDFCTRSPTLLMPFALQAVVGPHREVQVLDRDRVIARLILVLGRADRARSRPPPGRRRAERARAASRRRRRAPRAASRSRRSRRPGSAGRGRSSARRACPPRRRTPCGPARRSSPRGSRRSGRAASCSCPPSGSRRRARRSAPSRASAPLPRVATCRSGFRISIPAGGAMSPAVTSAGPFAFR